ncbi:MAG: bifunctional folylpolyglutamate synthase/dihydrofolate synthase [Opitutales bacterium]|nr:bifunctional folylpolyglutamate synthase/dihydrofolate synthase [Opitutales bacterium]
MKTVGEIQERIYALRGGGSKFSTEPMEALAAEIGNPQNGLKCAHIAGTNGKGSTAAFTEAILRAHGFSCGMYTSPHLLKINERVQINRENISDGDFVSEFEILDAAAKRLAKKSPSLAPTFFEYMTALAFQHFRRKKAQWCVFETGLGGRLDATNILRPKICAITSIGFDHMQYLGGTLAEIAAEKAGIIKENTPVVCGILPEEAMRVMEKTAKEKNAPLYKLEDYFTKDPQFDASMGAGYQRKNAALAFLICKILGDMGEIGFSEAAAKDAIFDTFWAARWQKIQLKNSTLILDCSHNAEGAAELAKNLDSLIAQSGGAKPVVACGILGAERAAPLLEAIAPRAKKIIFLEPKEDRALSFEELKECMPKNSKTQTQNSAVEELFPEKNSTSAAAAGETLVCTGSCYLAGEILARISGAERDGLQDILPSAKKSAKQ